MRSSPSIVVALSLLAPLILGCMGTGEDRVLGIDATGMVGGLVYFDANGDRAPDVGDPGVANVRVRLLVSGTQDTVARASSDGNGFFRMIQLPVGSYHIAIDSTSVADSVSVVSIDTTDVTVAPDDTVPVFVAISFPKVSITAARGLAAGEKVFVDGVTLNGRDTFGDQTLHLTDGEAAIRATRVRNAGIFANDSVRLLGRTATDNGQPTLDDVSVFLLALTGAPGADVVTSAVAGSADGGRFDAALVEVRTTTIQDTLTVGDGFQLTVDDGSGPLSVLLDKDVAFGSLTPFVPDAVIDAKGLLVPDGAGAWILKPRTSTDLLLRQVAPLAGGQQSVGGLPQH